MEIPTVWKIILPGVGIAVLASWMGGDLKFGAGRKFTEESLKKLAILTMASIGTGSIVYLLTRPATPSATVPKAPQPIVATESLIKLASPVGVNNWVSEPRMEFYSGTPPYPEGQHIFVD